MATTRSRGVRPGSFITVEGVDGSGKSSLMDAIVSKVQATWGVEVVKTREPGGTSIGEDLREVFMARRDDGDADATSVRAELLIILAARAQHLEQLIRPALARGAWVVSDRFNDSTYAYQGGGRQLAEATIKVVEQALALDQPMPDLTLLLDLPVDIALERLAGTGRSQRNLFDAPRGDRMHQTSQRDFLQRVRAAYAARAKAEPERWQVLDARLSQTDLNAQALSALRKLEQTPP